MGELLVSGRVLPRRSKPGDLGGMRGTLESCSKAMESWRVGKSLGILAALPSWLPLLTGKKTVKP